MCPLCPPPAVLSPEPDVPVLQLLQLHLLLAAPVTDLLLILAQARVHASLAFGGSWGSRGSSRQYESAKELVHLTLAFWGKGGKKRSGSRESSKQ